MKGMLKKFAEMQASDGFCLSVRVVGSWGGKSTVRTLALRRAHLPSLSRDEGRHS